MKLHNAIRYLLAIFVIAILVGLIACPISYAQESTRRIYTVLTLPTICRKSATATDTVILFSSGAVYTCVNPLAVYPANWGIVGGTGTTINSTDGAIPYRSSSTTFSNSPLQRIDANTIVQVNGVNAQKFYSYDFFTDSSNYSRLENFYDGAGTHYLRLIGLGTGAGLGFIISSQGTLRFAGGGGSGILITASTDTDLKWGADNIGDIGASGANRPRTGYFGTSIFAPTIGTLTGDLAIKIGSVTPFGISSTTIYPQTTNKDIGQAGGFEFRTGYFLNLSNGANNIYQGGTPSIAGNATLNTGSKDSAGKITSTGTGASTAVITFSTAFTRAPACFVTNETTANLVRPISTTTTLTINATVVTSDVLSYICLGY